MTRGVPSDQSRSGWWYRASQEEKLAQVDGCIEVGMTVRQCAMNVGCLESTLCGFAVYHGRQFIEDDFKKQNAAKKFKRALRRRPALAADKRAYLAGEPVDFWSAT